MSIQNFPSDMFVKTVERPENQGSQGLFQHFRGLLKEKILLKFLPKSEGAIASPTPLAPTTLLIGKENTNDLDSSVDLCQKERETLVKENSVTVTIHASADEEIVAKKIVKIQADKEETDKLIENADDADDLTKALPIEENKNDLDSTADPCQEKDDTLVKENSVKVKIHENTADQIVDEKIVGIQVHTEETDEMEMMPLT